VRKDTNAVLKAYNFIREGEFAKALSLVENELIRDKKNFWAYYLASVAAGYLQDNDKLILYHDKAKELNQQSVFLHYISAYIHLAEGNHERALWEWTRLIDFPEGWLARNLIEKERKGTDLYSKASEGNISYFIVLPEHLAELSDDALVNNLDEMETLSPERRRSFGIKKVFLSLIIFVSFIYLFYTGYNRFFNKKNEMTIPKWEKLHLDNSALVIPPENSKKSLYIYKDREMLLDDFESAKEMLNKKKINKARFLLQRILLSNADFQSKEKSKIFLNFIDTPEHENFNDPVLPSEIFSTQEFYTNSIVLWEGDVIDSREVDKGKEFQLDIRENDRHFIVYAFLHTGKDRTIWSPYSEFKRNQTSEKTRNRAVIYGRYKGMIGNPPSIYIELLKLWM